MPIPKPQSDESNDDFIARCMADPVMNEDFPENGQRFAICQRQWEEDKAEGEEKNEMPKDNSTKRWFSTGFMGGGVGTVDADAHALHEAVMIRPGEAMGHDLWIDAEFCSAIAARGNASGNKGLKARFGHPNMCSEALGTFLGRWKGLKVDESGRVTGDLFLSSTAAESPKGDLRKYVEEMAAKEPEHFGASVVFTRDEEAEYAFMSANGGETGFRSPDPNNARNLPHARCAELHAADLVDDPAATDGMFAGAAGLSLAAQMTEWLDTHPGVLKAINDEPALLDIVTRYADELKPFLTRYTENLAKKELADAAESTAVTVAKQVEAVPAEPDAELTTRVQALESQLNDATEAMERMACEHKRIAGELADMTSAFDAAVLSAETRALEVSVLTEQLAARDVAVKQAEDARDEARRKLAAIEAGAPPLSAGAAEVKGTISGSMWDDARKSKRRS